MKLFPEQYYCFNPLPAILPNKFVFHENTNTCIKTVFLNTNLIMKLFPNVVHGIISALNSIFVEQKKADHVIEKLLKSNPKWGSRDRRFIAESVYSVVRWYRLYYEIMGHQPQNNQDWWGILGIHWLLKGEELPAFEEFKHLDQQQVFQRQKTLSEFLKIKASIPNWLDELGQKELGENWEATVLELNQEQNVCLRVNTLKTTVQNCVAELHQEGIDVQQKENTTLILTKRAKLTHLKSFKNGNFEVQDEGSQLIAPFLAPLPGTLVIDACGGAGGKSLHLASLMKNKGQIISMDIHAHKLHELNKRSKRAGVKIIETKLISDQNLQELKESADYLLLDVPCSGLGVLKRNPDAKWKLNLDFISTIKTIQQQIIQNYSKLLKPKGRMVYATCSILPSENEGQVNHFLNSPAGTNFKLLKQASILPQSSGTDGFYMALLEKN